MPRTGPELEACRGKFTKRVALQELPCQDPNNGLERQLPGGFAPRWGGLGTAREPYSIRNEPFPVSGEERPWERPKGSLRGRKRGPAAHRVPAEARTRPKRRNPPGSVLR